MKRYTDSVANRATGQPVPNAQIRVYNADSSPAQLYSDDGVTTLNQPVLTNGLGLFYFYVADGTYTLTVQPPGSVLQTFPSVEIYEDATTSALAQRAVLTAVGQTPPIVDPTGAADGKTLVFASGTLVPADPSASAPVQSVAGKIGAVALAASDVGLGNVNNTSDANKPVSTAQATAIAAKYDASNPSGFVNSAGASAAAPVQSVAGKSGAVSLAKTDVGLANVDNTSDANKPVSAAQSAALGLKANLTDLAAANGVTLVGGAVSGVQAKSSNFLAGSASINRINDRVLVGAAADNDAAFPNVTKDWLSAFETTVGGRSNGTMVSAQAGILNNGYFGAGVGLLTGVQSLNFINATTGASGLTSIAVNNNATYATNAWAFYGEAHRANETVGSAIAMELDVSNFGTAHPITPYLQNAKETVALQLAAGAEYPSAGQSQISAAINIRDNPITFTAGIVFGATSLFGVNGTDADTGNANAILLARRHRITWMTSSGLEAGSVQCTITDANVATTKNRLAFTDNGTAVLGPTDNIAFLVRPVSSITNFIDITPGGTGIAPIIKASGSDSSIDLKLTTTGTGLVAFGNAANFLANGSVATSLGSVGPVGSHTTVQKWLSIKDATGTQLYIPCF